MRMLVIIFFATAQPHWLTVDMGTLSFDECQQARWSTIDTLFEHYQPKPMSITAQCEAVLPPLPTPRPE